MTVTDWRQYKTKPENLKGFKCSKPRQAGRTALLKPLRITLKPSQVGCEIDFDFSNLTSLEPLKPLKPKGGKIERNSGEEKKQFQIYAERWEERAAIKEFDGGMSREQAEGEAAREYHLTAQLQELRSLVGQNCGKSCC